MTSADEFIRLKLTGTAPGHGIMAGSTVSLIDADTGKAIMATNLHLFLQKGYVMAEVTVYLSEIDLETKAEKIVKCHKCQREQNPGLDLISGEVIQPEGTEPAA